MSTLVRKILRDVARRPLRNVLTWFGVVLGVAGVVAIATASQDVVDAQQLTYDSSNQADLAAFTGDLSPTSRDLIERNENVEVVDSRSAILTRFTVGDGQHAVRIFGLDDFSAMRLDIVELAEGSLPSRGEIAFDVSARDLADLDIGDIVAVQRTPADETYYLTVSGFTKSPATLGAGITNRAIAYTPATTVRRMNGRRADNYLLVRVRDRERASQTGSEISALLAKRGVAVGQIDVRDPENFVGARELNTLLLLLRIFSVLGAALASFLVANTLSAVIAEETAQIGIVKALGGVRRQITLTYLGYGTLIGLAGSIAGFGLGLVAGRRLGEYLTSLTGLQLPALQIRPLEVALAGGVGMVVTVGAALVPSIRSAGRSSADLLRSPGIRSEYRSRAFQRLTAPLAQASRSFAVGLRNVVRRPGRSALTITVVAVAVAAFVSTQALSSSVSGTADELYGLYGADAWIFFRGGADVAIARTIAREPEVLQAEAWTVSSAAIGTTRTDVWGMPDQSPLYRYRLVAGSWIRQTNPPSVVLTSNLASAIGAGQGDMLDLDIGERRETVQVIGIVDDPSTYLGNTGTGKAFMTVSDLHRLLGRGSTADLIALKLRDPDPNAVDAVLADLERRYQALGPGTLAAHSDRESTQQAIGILTQLLRAMVVIVGVVGITGIANTLIINVTERRHEIGVLRAIGARSMHLLQMLVLEGVSLALCGIALGLAIGIPVAHLLVDLTGEQLFELSFILDIPTLLGALAIGLAAVACVSAFPGLVAARLRPIQVLRYE